MKKLLLFTERHFTRILIGYGLLQLLLLFRYPMPYAADSRYFYELAQYCLQNGILYPAPVHLYHDYLVAPVFVNVLIALLSVWNSQVTIGLFSIVLNMLQLYLLYQLAEKLFSARTAVFTCLISVFYLNNLGMILMNFNDLLFSVLITGAIVLYMRGSYSGSLLAGVLTGVAMGVRPFAVALMLVVVFLGVWRFFKKKEPLLNTSAFAAGAGVAILCVGLLLKGVTGTFVFTSNFSGLNLIIGACDDARGGFQSRVFEKGKAGYIENIETYTHTERERIWTGQALRWIQEHPVRWALLAPVKIIRMYMSDDFAVSRLMFSRYSIYHVFRGIRDGEEIPVEDKNHSPAYFAAWGALLILHHLFYFTIIWFSLRLLKRHWHRIRTHQYLLHVLLFCITGIILTTLAYGEARYKYPYLFFHFMLAAEYVRNTYVREGIEK